MHNFGIFPHLAIFENTFYLKTGSDFATENWSWDMRIIKGLGRELVSEVISTPKYLCILLLKQEINFGWPTINMPTAENALGYLLITTLEDKQQ